MLETCCKEWAGWVINNLLPKANYCPFCGTEHKLLEMLPKTPTPAEKLLARLERWASAVLQDINSEYKTWSVTIQRQSSCYSIIWAFNGNGFCHEIKEMAIQEYRNVLDDLEVEKIYVLSKIKLSFGSSYVK